MDDIAPVLDAYVKAWREEALPLSLVVLAAAGVGFAAWKLLPRLSTWLLAWLGQRARRAVPLALLGLALVLGLIGVAKRASCFDDAFIFLRYSYNFAQGEGLVFNLGEYVEGYTNFLWTVLIGSLMWATRVDGPFVAMGACVVSYVANVLVVARLGAVLRPSRSTVYLPLAAIALALQPLSMAYGTSGLETQAASLCVNLGLLFLVTAMTRRRLFAAGAWFIVATLTRPDHGLYFAFAALVLASESAHHLVAAAPHERRTTMRKEALDLLCYAAPFVVYLAYLGWKYSYYGSIVPNTYYAKSANLTYFEQGRIYVTEFFLSHHAWPGAIALVSLMMVKWQPPLARFVLFSVQSLFLYTFYVAKVGGDFMEGRFLFTLLPFLLLALEQVFYRALAPVPTNRYASAAGAALSFAALISSTQTIDLIGGRNIKWGIANESEFYRVTRLNPFEVDHFNFPLGRILETLREAGHTVRFANKTVGMVAYYGRGYVLDRRGLTDAHVARLPLKERGRPGHEKLATMKYVRSRGVHFIDSEVGPKWLPGEAKLRFPGVKRHYSIVTYDQKLMRSLKQLVPGVRFTSATSAIDRYIKNLRKHSPEEVVQHLKWLRGYYFDQNRDPRRLHILEAYAAGDTAATLAREKAETRRERR